MEGIVKDLEVEEQLQFYFITDNPATVIKPLLEVCNPGKGENVDGFVGNKKLVLQKWEDKLYKPLNKILLDFDKLEKVSKRRMVSQSQLIRDFIQDGLRGWDV